MKILLKLAAWGLCWFSCGVLIGIAGQSIQEAAEQQREEMCVAAREELEVRHEPIWLMDPMDESRVNIPAKYKGADYMLFTDGRTVFHFNLQLPGGGK